jgi:hypothetical protein
MKLVSGVIMIIMMLVLVMVSLASAQGVTSQAELSLVVGL